MALEVRFQERKEPWFMINGLWLKIVAVYLTPQTLYLLADASNDRQSAS
jgi:hypothetical protein